MTCRPIDRLFVTALICLAATGCAGYAGDVKEIRSSLLAGDKARALALSNRSMEVEEANHYPEKIGGDNALLVLERATIKQGRGDYESSALDFRVADKHLELLDLRNDTAGNIAKWMFSDSATVYKAPPHEKLMLSTLNMLNYLSMNDLEDARVEARRLAIMQKYLIEEESPEEAQLGLGSFLAGFTFEMSGRNDQALRAYDEALQAGDYPSLHEPIRRLAACEPHRSERLSAIVGPIDPADPPRCNLPGEGGTILVVSTLGLAPYKVAKRIPIGAALVLAGAVVYGPSLGQSNTQKANELAAKGLLKWVNFPVMNKSRPRYSMAAVSLDGKPVGTELGQNVTDLVLDGWDRVKGALIGAAITRMITRAVAGEATNQAIKAGGGNSGLALLAGLALEGGMMAADTPDTRSWVTLPSHVFVTRIEVPPGKHEISVTFTGPAGRQVMTRTVHIKPGGYAVASMTPMR